MMLILFDLAVFPQVSRFWVTSCSESWNSSWWSSTDLSACTGNNVKPAFLSSSWLSLFLLYIQMLLFLFVLTSFVGTGFMCVVYLLLYLWEVCRGLKCLECEFHLVCHVFTVWLCRHVFEISVTVLINHPLFCLTCVFPVEIQSELCLNGSTCWSHRHTEPWCFTWFWDKLKEHRDFNDVSTWILYIWDLKEEDLLYFC